MWAWVYVNVRLYIILIYACGCATRSERGNQSVFALFEGFAGHASLTAFAKTGGPDQDRTDDLLIANEALSQLSYRPLTKCGLLPHLLDHIGRDFQPHFLG